MQEFVGFCQELFGFVGGVDLMIGEGIATTHAVELMARTVGGRLGIKASGGIRTTEAALAMLQAGATRLGLSGSAAVLAGLPE